MSLEVEDQGQFLGERDVIGVTHKGDRFLLANRTNLEVFSFDSQAYRTAKIATAEISSGYYMYTHSGSVTTDDRYMVGRYRVTYNSGKGIFVYDLL